MRLTTRLKTLFRADAHGVVDALEDKALVLRQHLRDAASELDRKRCRVAALAAEDVDLGRQAERVRGRLESLEDDVTLALAQGQEDLARYSIRRLLPLRRSLVELDRRRREVGEESGSLAGRLAEQEAEYEVLERRIQGHLARLEDEREGGVPWPSEVELEVTDEDVELELLRRQAAGEGGG